jgi:hypothetical protein
MQSIRIPTQDGGSRATENIFLGVDTKVIKNKITKGESNAPLTNLLRGDSRAT